MIVVRVLRKLAQTGRAIICTIHQPSKEIFACFDALLLLKKGALMDVWSCSSLPARLSDCISLTNYARL